MGRPKVFRPNDPQLHLAVLSSYKDMLDINMKLNSDEDTWSCSACKSNSYLPVEYGCKACQPVFGGKQLTGRVYKK